MEVKKLWYDRLYLPKQPNEKMVGAYLASKMFTRQIPKLGELEGNISGDARFSCYLARKELHRAEALLASKRKLAIETRKSLDRQWADISEKEEDLRETFITFNEFVKENEEKRERAKVRIGELQSLAVDRNLEIQAMHHNCEELVDITKRVEKAIDRNQIYENFLNSFVEKYPDEFGSARDVIRKYESLMYTKKILRERQKGDMDKLDVAKSKSARLLEAYRVKIAGLTTRVADLNQRYESARLDTMKWEKLLLSIRTEATEKIIDLVAIKEACWRVYNDICRRKGVEPVFKNDYGKQFDVIKKTLYDLECVNKMVRALEEEKLTLSEKPCVSDGTELLSGPD